MQVIFHIGAHCTDEDQLLKSLLKSRGALHNRGVFVPGPGRYRTLLRQALVNLNGNPPDYNTVASLHNAIVGKQPARRLILSNSGFMCAGARIFADQLFYGRSGQRLRGLSGLFPDAGHEIFLGIRNPATFIPTAYVGSGNDSFIDFMQGMTARDVKWSSVVRLLRGACPGARLTVWCNEDTPLIWPELLHNLTGLACDVHLDGETDILARIMSEAGLEMFQDYLRTHPPRSEMHKRRIIIAFLDKFALPPKLEEELDVPGWTQDLVDQLTKQYEYDIREIKEIPGVRFIQP